MTTTQVLLSRARKIFVFSNWQTYKKRAIYYIITVEYGKYTDYLNDWQRLIHDDPGFPLHIMYFEDLKKVCFYTYNKSIY